MKAALIGLACLLNLGCASRTAQGPAVDVTGVWTGTSGSYGLTLTLKQAGSDVTGTQVVSGYAASDGPVIGSVAGSQFSYTAPAGGGGDLTVYGDAMTGRGKKAGFVMNLQRQR